MLKSNKSIIKFKMKERLSKNIQCNMCGTNSYDIWDIRQNFKILHNCIVATPPKYSRYDSKVLQLGLCNKCMNKLFDYLIMNCVINPIKDNKKL